ncbi:MAG: carboxypeptidase regulatory-like domain-containing protein [Planctomycetes bacterium]|nr:carboxypeptidase regulatory-like domain-containing protein [Planctomycetota bacterium]
MHKALPVGIVVLVAGLVVFALWPRGGPTPPSNAPSSAPAADAPGAAQAEVAGPLAAPPAAPSAPERTAAPPAAGAPGPVCTLRGRCVDSSRQPIAGLRASLTGWGANDQRVQAWLRDHDEPARIDQRQTTGADGVFEFRFWPPPPFQFALRLRANGVATWGRRWNELAAGTEDLGDVRLGGGTLLRGRVVDAGGAPVGKVEVRIEKAAGRLDAGGFEDWSSAYTGDDGTFAARWALRPGDYRLGIDDQQIARGELVTLTGEPQQEVEVVLKQLDDNEAIRGIVVDQDGAPVHGASVHPMISGPGRLTSTDREGHFRVLRPAKDAPARVRLWVTRTGYEAEPDQQEYEWGRTDVRLVLRKGLGIDVLVVRASDGAPVEDYTLRVVPISGTYSSSEDNRPRGASPHEGGRERVEGVRIGEHQVIVEPKGETYAIAVATVTVAAGTSPQVVVSLAANTPRQVRVRFADDRPVPGARVLLVDPLGEPLTAESCVYQLSEWGNTTAKKALVLDDVTTDDRGEVTLHAPTDRPLGLSLPGPEHEPMLVPVVTFPAAGPFVVTVDQGAVLLASVGPPEAIAELRRLAGIDDKGASWFDRWPNLYLEGSNARAPARFPDLRERCSMQPDGTFTLRGIPGGRWRVTVSCFRKQERGGSFLEVPAGTVDLAAGQETKLAIDFAMLLPRELSGLVLHNGAPLANTKLQLQGFFGPDSRGDSAGCYEQVTTDGEGRFRTTVRGTAQRISWNRSVGQRWSSLRSLETVLLTPGQPTHATFTLASGTLQVRLLDAGGAPVPKVAVHLRETTGQVALSLPPTDAEGRTTAEPEAGTFHAQVLPKALQDPQALTEFYRAHAGEPDPTAALVLPLGTVTIRAGETTEIELRLPESWGR